MRLRQRLYPGHCYRWATAKATACQAWWWIGTATSQWHRSPLPAWNAGVVIVELLAETGPLGVLLRGFRPATLENLPSVKPPMARC
jgi:hypothetical protein